MLFEGPLSKWTNVIQGWQYRFFVLDPTQGMLIYYTSKENMAKGERRGVVLLRRAFLGIDSEDDSTFTIRSHGKTFHFQARDAEERQKWISNLEEAISLNSINTEKLSVSNTSLFERKISEADAYLQLLIDQVNELEQKGNQEEDTKEQECSRRVIASAKRLIEAVKYSIVSLQLAKVHMDPHSDVTAAVDYQAVLSHMNIHKDKILHHNEASANFIQSSVSGQSFDRNDPDNTSIGSLDFRTAVNAVRKNFPVSSYSSSDDDGDFYDAGETMEISPSATAISVEQTESTDRSNNDVLSKTNDKSSKIKMNENQSDGTNRLNNSQIPFEIYESAYEEEPEEELAPIDGTIISHLISQARISMDLTKITLPTFILERRSFLEMLADFLAHPDQFVNVTDHQTPRDRFIQVVKWYLSAFHAGRKSAVPKKPYNPILGETFQCCYDIGTSPSSSNTLAKDGPVPWSSDGNVTFIAEQTSHHPPIASFYAECPAKHIQIDGCLWTKSKFLGLSVAVHMIGDATLTLLDHDEHYVMTFPSAYGRSILGVPWFEMGGKVSIDCEKTGYSANIEFLTKPFYNGKKHQITGTLLGPEKKEFCKIDGEWNGIMYAKYSDTKISDIFFDTKSTPVIKKNVRPLVEQDDFESRRLWKDVTFYLKSKQLDKATESKSFLEQRQREGAKERADRTVKWQTKYFMESGEQKWSYEKKLNKRLKQQS
ncbi:unnamed protein product [Rotaria socialis]|uniref:PH domain-containing protein n=1 Tax=Rotaria socialis TaxID=392032 RepID=A0A817U4C6_9BILA|nr:unnamed protein product [Rotaria socialis]CAF3328936.1 unnamed protein product [Rotaria socialis]CAF4307551.1 unnamed protein product [Rotaria socialis]CAF4587780.1 unnamed protein product [Rotaria socialis]